MGTRRRVLCAVGIATGIVTIVGGTIGVLSPGFVRILAVGALLVGVGAIVVAFAILGDPMVAWVDDSRSGSASRSTRSEE